MKLKPAFNCLDAQGNGKERRETWAAIRAHGLGKDMGAHFQTVKAAELEAARISGITGRNIRATVGIYA